MDTSTLDNGNYYGYKLLAISIVKANIDDWIEAQEIISTSSNINTISEYTWQRERAEDFFRSPRCALCSVATGLDGEYIIKALRHGAAKKLYNILDTNTEDIYNG